VPDLYDMTLGGCTVISSGWSYSFTAYTVFCIRVGTDKGGKFFALGKRYQVPHNILEQMVKELKSECADKKLAEPAVIPKDCRHGTYCLCLTYKDDMAATEVAMRTYLEGLVKTYPESKKVPEYFYIGDQYDLQQRSIAIFQDAFATTRDAVLKGSYESPIEPFNEGEAVKILLRNIARQEFAPRFRETVPNIPIGCIQWQLWYTSDMLVLGLVDTAINAGWPPIQLAVNKARDEIVKLIDSGAAKLVAELKPVIVKVLTLIQSKMKKKEEQKEKEKSPAFGDVAVKWRFERSEIGKMFWENLNQHDARVAMKHLRENSDSALEQFLQQKMSAGTKALLGDGVASMELVQAVLEVIAEQIVKTVQKYTTLEPLMKGAERLFECRNELEKDLIACRSGGADALNKALETASRNMWKTLPNIGLNLFMDMHSLKGRIDAQLAGVCADGIKPFTDVADHLYALQMKALNSLRVQFVNQLKARLPSMSSSDDQVRECIRTTWREITFQIIQVVVKEAWVDLCEAFTVSCIAQVKDKFNKDIWPTIAAGLAEIQALIPEALAKMGLEIAPLALSVCMIIIEKGVRFGMTKLLLKLESAIFLQ